MTKSPEEWKIVEIQEACTRTEPRFWIGKIRMLCLTESRKKCWYSADIDFQCISAIPTGSICIVTSWVVVVVRSYATSEVVDIWFGNFLGKKWRQERKAAVDVALNRIQIASTQRGGELQGLQGLIKLLAKINFQFLLNVKLKSE